MVHHGRPRVVILGGAGFIGSHIASALVAQGAAVSVIDGLIPGTGGSLDNVRHLDGEIDVEIGDVGSLPGLPSRLRSADVIIDAMAWTSHRLAMDDPIRDLRLNCECHLHVIAALRPPAPPILFLGSRGQYGHPDLDVIVEATPQVPVDVQGIHKTAAESYYRVFSRHRGFRVRSLRFANCFGERGPIDDADAGLIGNFIRSLLKDGSLTVFGEGRRRNVLYAGDLATAVVRLISAGPWQAFDAYNLSGHDITIDGLARLIVEVAGVGAVEVGPLPAHIAAFDAGAAGLDDTRLHDVTGAIPLTPLRDALSRTIADYRRRMG
jgi:UDP-glucose 4-epimerase